MSAVSRRGAILEQIALEIKWFYVRLHNGRATMAAEPKKLRYDSNMLFCHERADMVLGDIE